MRFEIFKAVGVKNTVSRNVTPRRVVKTEAEASPKRLYVHSKPHNATSYNTVALRVSTGQIAFDLYRTGSECEIL